MLKETTDSPYTVGQIWTYHTRVGEESSRLTIVKTECHPKLGNIIHISVSGLRISNRQAPDGITHEITHLPFAEQAIAQSVREQVSQQAVPADFEDGYNQWRQAFEDGQAGIWTITVAECIEAMEQIMRGS